MLFFFCTPGLKLTGLVLHALCPSQNRLIDHPVPLLHPPPPPNHPLVFVFHVILHIIIIVVSIIRIHGPPPRIFTFFSWFCSLCQPCHTTRERERETNWTAVCIVRNMCISIHLSNFACFLSFVLLSPQGNVDTISWTLEKFANAYLTFLPYLETTTVTE